MYSIEKINCEKCGELISKNNMHRHIDSNICKKNQVSEHKIIASSFFINEETGKYICPICNLEFSKHGIGNHYWRKHTDTGKAFIPNPTLFMSGWNKGLTKETDERILRISKSLSKIKSDKNYKHTGCCSEEYLCSEEHKYSSSRGGGYKENAGRSKKFKVVDSYGRETTLQSTYELLCMETLNAMCIKWSRPKALKYTLDGKIRNYFGDFYLNDYNIILDTKNDYKAKQDKLKISLVNSENNIKVFVLLFKDITEEYIRSII